MNSYRLDLPYMLVSLSALHIGISETRGRLDINYLECGVDFVWLPSLDR